MELATRPPHSALAPLIRSLAGWHERADGPVRRAELPGGRIVLVITFGPTLDVDGRRFGSFVAGLHDSPALTEHAGEGHGIQAYLTPLGARRLLGLPMGELTGQVVELEDLIGPRAHELAERLAGLPDWAARFALLERAIAERALEAEPVAAELEHAWRRLQEPGVSIGALADEIGWSRRHFTATVREELGMPPKPLARLLRFERAVGRLREGAELVDVALDSGYYDQAHFNRDFRAFAGVTPTAYRVASVQDMRSLAA
ncbi:MAG TPA: helix-turn-helix domain-containing protein [Solirubrobacteraceae bacterium]|nr:helix-turn-helix domain-containing protein [Solirubrobacteraceae bacterium]